MPFDARWKQRHYAKHHYRRNRDRYIADAKAGKDRARKIAREYVQRIKDGQTCPDCGGVFRHWQFDFDHVRGSKAKNVGDLVAEGVNLAKIRAEIAKCELVCRNCHATRTWMRAQAPADVVAPADEDALTLF